MRAGNGGTYGGREEKDPDPHGGRRPRGLRWGAQAEADLRRHAGQGLCGCGGRSGRPAAGGQCRRGRVGAGGGDGVAGRARAALGRCADAENGRGAAPDDGLHGLSDRREMRAREPLDRRRVEENVTRTDLDSALRVASDIPNEIVYIMCRCIELMKEVVDKGDDLTACSALAAVHLSMAAIRCMQAELLSYAKIMDDDVFGYTIVREAELNLADHQELVDGLVEELTRRLTRAKK